MIDYTTLFRANLPAAAVKYNGFPKYNFVGGHNDAGSVPVDDLIAAASNVLKREGSTLATYGLQSGPQGYRALREFLVKKLGRDAGIACAADDILITGGSQQALELVNSLLLEKGDTIVVEEASYGGFLSRVKRFGVNMVPLPLDKQGLDIEAVGRALADLKSKGIRPKYLYTIPTVQNPTASILPLERRHALIKLCESYGVPILEDECYSDLVWDGKRPQAMRGITGDDRVIYVGSFSKSIAPALRLGYIVAGWPLMSRLLSLKTDSGTGAIDQMVIAEYCEAHFDNHVVKLRKTLKRKLDAMVEAVGANFGTAAEFDYPDGGIFLWIKLPDSVDTAKLFQAASKEGVTLNPGAEWSVDPAYGQSRLRLCFANPTEQTIREGVAKLAEICNREFGVPTRIANVGR
ncbi:PLP-dependent aminotransferase family protein [Hyphomicrobium sp. CS1BSMeth3]|uniref:aminotransferase-like domain-containing protein n=1 Tax=Hyphomicrobium sp. CS1BSMeth3 TaxID=1892844 RepID=UPI000931408F|nr:PLP-dependent aminotransferase family protein [Hyphomicrobium sp. CS1BSMeth3]